VIADVVELTVEARPTAVIAEATTWAEFPQLWPALLGEVWTTVRTVPDARPGRNVMLYLDDVPHVEIGVEADGAFGGAGRVVPSSLPGGRVVTAKLVGGYDEIDAAHRAVGELCDRLGLRRLGPRWEVYGHETGDPDKVVDVYYLVA
jgi:effector-binding domain-containing protein